MVVLMSIFLTLGMAAFNAQVGSAALSATKKKQEIIRDALIAYLRDFKRLPCPEVTAFAGNAPTGVEGRQTAGNPTTTCASFWGTLPYGELGLSRDVALDGYENFFTYFVSSAQAGEPDWTLTTTAVVPGFGVGNPGRFAITENDSATTLSKNLAAVVIVSHGSNGLGAFTSKGTRNVLPDNASQEKPNALDTPSLPHPPPVWTPPSQVAVVPPTLPSPGITTLVVRERTEAFDDVVLVLRPNDLLTPIFKDGALRSAEALIQEQLAMVRDAAIAQLLSNACQPVSPSALATSLAPASLPIDPWGMPIKYDNAATAIPLTASTPASTTAFSIWSFGPDRAVGGGDDRSLSTGLNITFGQVRARIPATACP